MKNKGKLLFLAIISSFFISGCSEAPFSGEDFIKKIFPNVWDFLATFLAFIVLIIVAFFFGYKPIKKFIKKRQDYIDENIKTAEQREIKSRNLVKDAESELANSKKQAITILEEARENANKQKEEIIKQAKEEAKLEKEKASEEIAQEIIASKDEIHREIVSVALSASKKVLEREVNNDDNKRLVNDFVNDLNKEDK